METLTPREAPKIRVFNSKSNAFEDDKIWGDMKGVWEMDSNSVVAHHGQMGQHLHALRTAEINGHTVTEYDVGYSTRYILLSRCGILDEYDLVDGHFENQHHENITCANFREGFNALEHPERLEYTIPREVLDAHPLLAQAVARVDKHAPLRKELAELKQRAQEDAARIERLEGQLG